jgi:hypothetical protein
MYSSTHSLTSALDGGEWSASHPDRFTLKERSPGTHWIGGWVDPRAVLDSLGIIFLNLRETQELYGSAPETEKLTHTHTGLCPKVSRLAAWSENYKWYSSLPLGAVVSLFCESV